MIRIRSFEGEGEIEGLKGLFDFPLLFSEVRVRRWGFTLMELLLVMGMISVIALLFVSYTGDVGNVAVDALTRKIQSDIRYAQQLATSSGVAHGVQFVQGGNYTVYVDNATTPALDPLTRMPMVEDMVNFGDVQIVNNYQVEFDTLGKPTVGGGGNVEVLAGSGAWRRVYIIKNTGAVVVDVLDYGAGCGCRIYGEER